MAVIKPFKALRPRHDVYQQVASVPYDVVNTEEARELAKGNDLSFLHVVRPEIDFEPGKDPYDADVYEKAKENFEALKTSGVLRYDNTECLYLYSQKMGKHVQVGLVAVAGVDDYDSDVIKKHEKTRRDKEDDRTRHVLALNANSGPVFLTYRQDPAMDSIVERITKQEPVNSFTAPDRIEHKVWVIEEQADIRALVQTFTRIPYLYVADGHHRSASASRARAHLRDQNSSHIGQENYNYFLCVMFPDNQLQILPYNRVVKDLNGMAADDLKNKISEKFEVLQSGVKSPDGPLCISMYLNKKWYSLKAKEGTFNREDPVQSLDVSILQENVLSQLLAVEDPRTSKRIDFVGGIRGTGELEKLVDSGKYAIAFSMFPTTVKQLMAIADAGMVMPPKSTWFEPKLRSGLMIHGF